MIGFYNIQADFMRIQTPQPCLDTITSRAGRVSHRKHTLLEENKVFWGCEFETTFFMCRQGTKILDFVSCLHYSVRYHLLVYSAQHIFINSVNNFFFCPYLQHFLFDYCGDKLFKYISPSPTPPSPLTYI